MRWQKVEGYESYSVSTDGSVRNDDTGELKTPTLNNSTGYLAVDLYSNGKRSKKQVHRLVAEAFIPNDDSKPTVDHIDGDRTNNSADNLRWATYSENNSRFGSIGVRSESIAVFHYIEERKRRGGGHEKWCGVDSVLNFDRIGDAAEYFGVSISNISQMLKKGSIGRRGKMRGYRFEYMHGRKCSGTCNDYRKHAGNGGSE